MTMLRGEIKMIFTSELVLASYELL